MQVSALDWLVNFLNSFWESIKTLFFDALSWLSDNIFDSLIWLLDRLYNLVLWFLNGLYLLLEWLLNALSSIVQAIFLWTLDGMLTLVYLFVASLDLSSFVLNYWGLLSPQMLYVVNQSGIPQGLSLLAWALGIRLLLNLIPAAFTRV